MMPEISLSILDVAENSIRAKALHVHIAVLISTALDTLIVNIKDDGCGMDEQQVKQVTDPFFTTRTTRKVGLGIPFFKESAESTGGSFDITSEKGVGTSVKAVFRLSSIDRMPLGNINETIYALVVFNESVDFHYKYAYDAKEFIMDTKEMKEILGGVSLKDAEVSRFIKEYLETNQKEVDDGKTV